MDATMCPSDFYIRLSYELNYPEIRRKSTGLTCSCFCQNDCQYIYRNGSLDNWLMEQKTVKICQLGLKSPQKDVCRSMSSCQENCCAERRFWHSGHSCTLAQKAFPPYKIIRKWATVKRWVNLFWAPKIPQNNKNLERPVWFFKIPFYPFSLWPLTTKI